MKTSIKDILDDMILKLEEMANEELVLRKIYREHYEKKIANESEDDREFYMSIIDLLEDVLTLEHFEPNDIMKALYAENLERTKELQLYSLKLYKLYNEETNEKIPYLEDVKKQQLEMLRLANEKEIINVYELELIYGYSATTQKGYRSRLNNPIPFIQKRINCNIMYNKKAVEKWLNDKK